jgi:hypothetical protein
MGEQLLFAPAGSIVEFTRDVETTPWPGEKAKTVRVGARYKLVRIVGAGWDLSRVQGNGPEELRLLDSQMGDYVKLIIRVVKSQ